MMVNSGFVHREVAKTRSNSLCHFAVLSQGLCECLSKFDSCIRIKKADALTHQPFIFSIVIFSSLRSYHNTQVLFSLPIL